MFYFYSLILGVVQGLTEFLPVSSSGHLVLLHNILNFNLEQNLAFDVALHLGTVLAIIIFFWQDLIKYIKSFFSFIFSKKYNQTDLNIVWAILIAIFPAGLAGVLFDNMIETKFRSSLIVIVMLIVGAILFFVIELLAKQTKVLQKLNKKNALVIGLAQVLALIPGMSRSGITIVAGMATGLTRASSARFSFLMGAPIIFGAGLFKIFDINWLALSFSEILMFIIGFVSSFMVGLIVIKFLLKFLENHKLNIFAYYRLILAGILIIYLYII